jgi:tetratricopeptide (TPR) repeat protein
VAVSFVASGIAIVAAGIGGGGATSGSGASGVSTTDENQARVDNALAAAESSPGNAEVVIQVGHAYFEWAVAVYESGQQAASIPLWNSAVSYYDKVLALDPSHDIALGNKAFALYYAQDVNLAPAALRAFIDGASDNASLAQQLDNARGMLAELEAASTATTTTP